MGMPEAAIITAEKRIAQSGIREKDREAAVTGAKPSTQSGPIVGDKDGVHRIGGVVFNAGGLACDESFEADLAFKAGNVLSRVVDHP
jgi:hypothetical protein